MPLPPPQSHPTYSSINACRLAQSSRVQVTSRSPPTSAQPVSASGPRFPQLGDGHCCADSLDSLPACVNKASRKKWHHSEPAQQRSRTMQQATARSAQQLAQAIKVAGLGGVGLYGLSHSIFNVEGGHRAIIFNRLVGVKETVCHPAACVPARCWHWAWTDSPAPCAQVYPEGTHLMFPWLERPIIYDVRAQPNTVQSTSGSRDLQMVRAVAHLVAGQLCRAGGASLGLVHLTQAPSSPPRSTSASES